MKRILALTGPKGSGKTTFAHLLRKHNTVLRGATILSFASPIKKMLMAVLTPQAFLPDSKENPAYGICGKSPRYLMQTLGTEWGRNQIGENIWAEALLQQIAISKKTYFIIDDLRFNNEAEMILDQGGKIIKIERPGFNYTLEHKSETPIDPNLIHAVVHNSTKESLHHIAKQLNLWNH